MVDLLYVHLLHEPKAEHLAFLRSRLSYAIEVTAGKTVSHRAQVLVAGRPTRNDILACPNLNTLIIPFAGLPPETGELMQEYPYVAIHNLHHNAPMTAEMAVTLLLAAAKHLIPVESSFRQSDWRPRYEPEYQDVVVLEGKTALILGYGAIGQRVGRICRGLGMYVLGIRRTEYEASLEVYPLESLHSLLLRADVLFVCLPGTPATTGLIGQTELRMLPQGAIVVNVGRGAVIDEAALYEALREGRLHSAGLDVWYQYPADEASRAHTPPSSYPFHELKNVVMSPHRAGGGGAEESEQRRNMALAEMLNQVARGEPLPHRVNLAEGY